MNYNYVLTVLPCTTCMDFRLVLTLKQPDLVLDNYLSYYLITYKNILYYLRQQLLTFSDKLVYIFKFKYLAATSISVLCFLFIYLLFVFCSTPCQIKLLLEKYLAYYLRGGSGVCVWGGGEQYLTWIRFDANLENTESNLTI